MNSTNKKALAGRGKPQPFNRQTGPATKIRPVAVQLKSAVPAQSVKRPVAPPVYRPQATPKAAQPKMATAAVNRKPPVAPPIYRPQQVPRVLQTKSSSVPGRHASPSPRRPVAPPVYRPEAKKIVQPKTISQLREAPTAPPVYRPEHKGIAQPKMTAAPAQTKPKPFPRNPFGNGARAAAQDRTMRAVADRTGLSGRSHAAPAQPGGADSVRANITQRAVLLSGARQTNAASGPARIAQLKKSSPASIVQLTKYQSLNDPGVTVDVDAGTAGVYAQAAKSGEDYKQSSLLYALNRYKDAGGEGKEIPTNVPMATQTDTMNAYPERLGIGTLMVVEAMSYLNRKNIQIFQPDIMQSDGGRIMKGLITGTNLSAREMEQLIADTDQGGRRASSGGCCSWLSCLPGFSKSGEDEALLDQQPKVMTYPAIRVDYEATAKTLSQKANEKFKVIG